MRIPRALKFRDYTILGSDGRMLARIILDRPPILEIPSTTNYGDMTGADIHIPCKVLLDLRDPDSEAEGIKRRDESHGVEISVQDEDGFRQSYDSFPYTRWNEIIELFEFFDEVS
jgi:hypothetical protein